MRTYITNMARSTSGEVAGLSSQLGRVRIPHESLNRNQVSGVRIQDSGNALKSEVWLLKTDHGLVRRNGALTCNQGDRVRFPACPLPSRQISGFRL